MTKAWKTLFLGLLLEAFVMALASDSVVQAAPNDSVRFLAVDLLGTEYLGHWVCQVGSAKTGWEPQSVTVSRSQEEKSVTFTRAYASGVIEVETYRRDPDAPGSLTTSGYTQGTQKQWIWMRFHLRSVASSSANAKTIIFDGTVQQYASKKHLGDYEMRESLFLGGDRLTLQTFTYVPEENHGTWESASSTCVRGQR